MEIVRQLDEGIWRDFVDNHPQGQIFHTPEMFRVFSIAKGHQPELWAAVENGHILVLFLPVRVSLVDGIFRTLTTRVIAYGGVLCTSGADGQRALDELLNVYRQESSRKSLFTEIRHPYDASALQPLLRAKGFPYEEHMNFLVNVQLPVEQVWKNIHRSARRSIQRTLKRNQFEVLEVDDPSIVAACYALFKKTYALARVPLADYSLFKAAFDVLYPIGRIKLLLGQVEGEYVAASAALLYKKTIYGWYRGFDRRYSAISPNDMMVWQILRWGAENGYEAFDFGGAGKPSEIYGPRQFKAKFGGELVNFGRNVCIHNPLRYRVSKQAYSWMRRASLLR